MKILVLEYCGGKNLYDEIREKKKIPEHDAILILKQVMNGIAELHSHKIIHRDLKPENIMSHNGVYKIIDFGFSKLLELPNKKEIKQTVCGTRTSMAP